MIFHQISGYEKNLEYNSNNRDKVRKTYLQRGPYQSHEHNSQTKIRTTLPYFIPEWFKDYANLYLILYFNLPPLNKNLEFILGWWYIFLVSYHKEKRERREKIWLGCGATLYPLTIV